MTPLWFWELSQEAMGVWAPVYKCGRIWYIGTKVYFSKEFSHWIRIA